MSLNLAVWPQTKRKKYWQNLNMAVVPLVSSLLQYSMALGLAHVYIFVRIFFLEDLGTRLNVMLRMTMWGDGMKSNLRDRLF